MAPHRDNNKSCFLLDGDATEERKPEGQNTTAADQTDEHLWTETFLLQTPLNIFVSFPSFRPPARLAGALQIENSEETDQGKYECVATNSQGVRYSSPANLYVRGRT